ncbi:hypothetical protein BACI9J_350002 [Bacillus altitudinis]|nr:hypothetical protein BACI9J_350002 [Bacillus altitudinis]
MRDTENFQNWNSNGFYNVQIMLAFNIKRDVEGERWDGEYSCCCGRTED